MEARYKPKNEKSGTKLMRVLPCTQLLVEHVTNELTYLLTMRFLVKMMRIPFIASLIFVQQWIKLLIHRHLFFILFIRIRVMSCQKIQRICKWQSCTEYKISQSMLQQDFHYHKILIAVDSADLQLQLRKCGYCLKVKSSWLSEYYLAGPNLTAAKVQETQSSVDCHCLDIVCWWQ